jgi:class 3 adenylate cyclase
MDVGGWLRRIGLEQYEAAFRENKIDDTVLRGLEGTRVGFVGHRRKLLDAIAALRAEASTQPSDAPLTEKAAAERRQVTVMFSDLVGSTALSARMDPEDLREIISAYQRRVAETVRRFGGIIAKYMATACSFISAIRRLMRMTPTVLFGPGSRWSMRLLHSRRLI